MMHHWRSLSFPLLLDTVSNALLSAVVIGRGLIAAEIWEGSPENYTTVRAAELAQMAASQRTGSFGPFHYYRRSTPC